jgi:cysteine desulfurase
MIYLDYAANTPVNEEVLLTFIETAKRYTGNPNSPHLPGRNAKARMDEAAAEIAGLLNVKETEVIFTSGASESNNLAIKGIAEKYKKYGRHIVTSFLEHSSVNGAIAYLKDRGFEIDYVDIAADGSIDLTHLEQLLRPDTILASFAYVDSEIGILQPMKEIADILSRYPRCLFHSDATQAVGKIPVSFEGIDLVTFAPHKFYGLNGSGVLIKREEVQLEPQIHGGISSTPFRSGSPALALAASAEKALFIALEELGERYAHIKELNRMIRDAFSKYPGIRINSTARSVPHILNLSIPGVNTEELRQELEKHGIYIATKSACCAPGTVSRPVYALTGDKKASLATIRISLSHLTTKEDAERFIHCFDLVYGQYRR